MVKVSIKFDDNFYTLDILEKQILFNYNLLYILNLEKPFNFEHLVNKEIIQNYNNFLIFSCKFRDKLELLELIKKQYKLQFIDFSLECFWCFTKNGDFIDEHIDLGIENYEIDLGSISNGGISNGGISNGGISNGPKDNYKDLNTKLNFIKDEVENYKKIILDNSLVTIYKKFNLVKEKINLIENFLQKTDNNLLKTKNINLEGIYLDDRELELNKTRKLLEINNSLEDKIDKLENKYIQIENKFNLLGQNDKYLNLPITISIKKEWRELAICVHLYDISLWDEIYSFIKNLKPFNLSIDLYINFSVNNKSILTTTVYKNLHTKINDLKMFTNIYFTDSDNCGMDIGGFLISYCKMLDLGLRYHQIIKIHSKTNKNWRYAMLYALLGNKTIIENNLKLMNIPNIGMIGNEKLSLNYILSVNKKSYKYLYTYMKYFGIKNIDNYGYFIPGTIFWIKGEILDSFFTKELLIKCYNEFEPYYCGSLVNNREGTPHAFERFFGVIVKNSGKKVVTYDTRCKV